MTTPGTGCGVVLANASDTVIRRCEVLGRAPVESYDGAPLPSGAPGNATLTVVVAQLVSGCYSSSSTSSPPNTFLDLTTVDRRLTLGVFGGGGDVGGGPGVGVEELGLSVVGVEADFPGGVVDQPVVHAAEQAEIAESGWPPL